MWWKFVYIICILRVKTAPCFIECFSSICVIVACQLCWNSTFTRPGFLGASGKSNGNNSSNRGVHFLPVALPSTSAWAKSCRL